MNEITSKPKGGRPTKYDPGVVNEVRAWCQMGATIPEVANFLGVEPKTVSRWMVAHAEFGQAMRVGREFADARMERALYEKGLHGDIGAMTKWLNNRKPAEWGGHSADLAPVQTVNIIDARKLVLEQLSEDQLAALESLSALAIAGPRTIEGSEAGETSEEGEEQP
jgi:hypothetical protein